MTSGEAKLTRREMLGQGVRAACVVGLGGAVGVLADHGGGAETVWQLDPILCTQCGKCATNCALEMTAVRCIQIVRKCGYCDLCFGYFNRELASVSTGAESQLCPTGAIGRKFVEDPYYEYTIDEELCIGCAKCVIGCTAFGNGSLFMQIRHDRCLNCNECRIARECPAEAIIRVPADTPYLLKEVRSS